MDGRTIRTVGIVGAGLMGSAIAGELARAGLTVYLHDNDPNNLQRARETVSTNLRNFHDEGLISIELMHRVLERIRFESELANAVRNVDLVIEATPEDIDLKKTVFKALDELSPPHAILTTNTSSLSVAEIASATRHPERVIACHFLHPAHLLPLVEITPSPQAKAEIIDHVRDFFKSIGKSPIVLRKEMPGYLAARLQMALFRECLYLVEQGVVSAEDIDKACKDGFGRRLNVMGPFEIADFSGLDLYQKTNSVIFPSLCNSATVLPTLEKLVSEGHTGVKSGEGFYNWSQSRDELLKTTRDKELLRKAKQDQGL